MFAATTSEVVAPLIASSSLDARFRLASGHPARSRFAAASSTPAEFSGSPGCHLSTAVSSDPVERVDLHPPANRHQACPASVGIRAGLDGLAVAIRRGEASASPRRVPMCRVADESVGCDPIGRSGIVTIRSATNRGRTGRRKPIENESVGSLPPAKKREFSIRSALNAPPVQGTRASDPTPNQCVAVQSYGIVIFPPFGP